MALIVKETLIGGPQSNVVMVMFPDDAVVLHDSSFELLISIRNNLKGDLLVGNE